MTLDDELRARDVRGQSSTCSHRVQFFDRSVARGERGLAKLLEVTPQVRVRDTLRAQVAELLRVRSPGRADAAAPGRVDAFLREHGGGQYGLWAYYPWRAELIRLLPRDAFIELRTNRNQLTITPDEQRRLRDKHIVLVGLSVGHGMAVNLALEGIGGRFLLADPDVLDLSNTNRLPVGVPGLGVNKARLAAQRMAEIDPFLEVDIWSEGVDRVDPARVFRERSPDLLIEECDDLVLKVALREHARAAGVPVLTETSQGGLLDVERYDLEPDRPLLHGLLGDVDTGALAGLTTRQKAPFGLRFMQGEERLSPRLAASLVEIEQSLCGWPQLGSAVAFGGGMVADVARRVLLGTFRQSGRFRVDLDQLVADDSTLNELRDPVPPPLAPEALPPRPSRRVGSDTGVRGWLRAALLAPSGGNSQPWRFRIVSDREVHCRVDPERAYSALDPRGLAAHLACGAAFEHLRLAAAADGFETHVAWHAGDDGRVFEASFEPCAAAREDPLWQHVARRCTNRRVGPRAPLPPGAGLQLRDEAARAGTRLHWVEEEDALASIARVVGQLDRARVFAPALHREMVGELRRGPGSERATDGISEASLELDEGGRAALAVLSRPEVASILEAQNGGGALRELATRAIVSASAFGRLVLFGERPRHFAEGGVALARVWLRATALGLQVQPMSAGAYMLSHLDLGPGGSPLDGRTLARLRSIHPSYARCFPAEPGERDALLFRVHLGEPASARAARRPLDEVLDP